MAKAILWLTLGFEFMLVVASPAVQTSSSTSSTLESTVANTRTQSIPSATGTSFSPSTPAVGTSVTVASNTASTTSDQTFTSTPTSTSGSPSTTPLSSSLIQTTSPSSSTITPLSSFPIQTTASTSTASSNPVLPSSQAHGTPPGTIALAVILSIIGCIFLFAILRCCNSYRKTPHYDRVAAAINRHLIYREMTENNRRPTADETMSTVSLPRYSPRPPTFASRESNNPFDDSHSHPSRPVSASSMHSSPFSDHHAGESRPVSTHSLHSDTVSVYSTTSSSFLSPFSDPAPQRTSYS